VALVVAAQGGGWRVAGRDGLGACGAGASGQWRDDARQPALLGAVTGRGSASAKTARRGAACAEEGPG
jgi:hypothetical protein